MCGVCLATSCDRAAAYLMELTSRIRYCRRSAVSPTSSRDVDPNRKPAATCNQRMAHIITSRTRPAAFSDARATPLNRRNGALERYSAQKETGGHDQLPARVRFRNRHWRCGCTRDDRLAGRNPTYRRSSLSYDTKRDCNTGQIRYLARVARQDDTATKRTSRRSLPFSISGNASGERSRGPRDDRVPNGRYTASLARNGSFRRQSLCLSAQASEKPATL
jgi:hypothetical protein